MQTPTDDRTSFTVLQDEELMLRYAQGDMDAFDELFQRHKTSVYSFIRKFIYAPDAVDDIFQTIFMRIIRNRKRYQPKAKFTTWLFTITRSVCIDAMRKQKTARVIQLFPPSSSTFDPGGDAPVDYPDKDPHPRDASYLAEMQDTIDAVIHSLPPQQREVLLLREKTGFTFEEIGSITGCSANTAKSRMHYALLSLRKGLKERGFDEP